MFRRIIPLLFFLSFINAQIALPTFQAVHKPHTTTSSGTFTFTNCDATGRDGPSQSDCNSEYSGTSLEGLVTVSSGVQTWTVPSTATYTIEVWGAQGGGAGADNTVGGLGAYLKGDFNLSAGDVIKILVGQAGGTVNYAGGGGGGTFCVTSDNTILIIAGAGGGGFGHTDNSRGYSQGGNGLTGTSGGNSSTPSGSYGSAASGSGGGNKSMGGSNGYGGGGGVAGGGGGLYGDGGNGYDPWGDDSYGSGFLNGGSGGEESNNSYNNRGGFGGGGSGAHSSSALNGYGGGGGGYSGGGGGSLSGSSSGNGGGGGSYNSSSTNTASTEGTREGHGQVVITF